MPLTSEQLSEACKRILDGESSTQIALSFGVSRNVVLGALWREKSRTLGAPAGPRCKPRVPIAPRPTFVPARRAPAVRPPCAAAPQGPESFPSAAAPVPCLPEAPTTPYAGARNISLFKLGTGDCRWPTECDGEGQQLFCAAARKPGRSYCPHHHALSFGRGTPSERAAVRDASRVGD